MPWAKTAEKSKGWKRRFAVVFFIACVLLVAFGFIFRKPLLVGAARLWIVDEPTIAADAIVVLGGNPPGRAGAAAEMYKLGLASKILVMNVALSETDRKGLSVGQSALTQAILVAANVPTNAVALIGEDVTSTHEEALALRDWTKINHPKTVIVPTDLFHTRRVNWWFEKTLKKSGTEVRVVAVGIRNYGATNWWQHEDGLEAFQNEVLKTGYYFLNH